MRIGADTAVVVCAGPSLDRLSASAWAEIGAAGTLVAVNGAAASVAAARNRVRFTCLAAMDLSNGLAERVPAMLSIWRQTTAWRVASTDSPSIEAESYVVEVDEENGVDGWSDDAREGYKGGSTAMVIGNWLGNAWPDDGAPSGRGKEPPRRPFRKLAYLGLDMHPGNGEHASGAGVHVSGFAASAKRYENVCRGWEKFCAEAARRGIEVVNFTPGTALAAMPRAAIPRSWVP
jgi:hypothetical protein